MIVPAKSGSSERVFTLQIACFLFAILIVHAATLHFMGRIAWCKCGFGLWTSHAWSSETSQMFADPYSATHVVHGILFYAVLHFLAPRASLRCGLWRRYCGSCLGDLREYALRDRSLSYRDGIARLHGRQCAQFDRRRAVCYFGVLASRTLALEASLAIVVGLELLLLVTVRDNLTLNLLMILYPIEAIKRWQTAA